MVENLKTRGRGRPPAFDDEDALDAAVKAFWLDGYEGTDVEGIATALGATKPSLYRRFGDKRTLFMRSLERYSQTVGMNPIDAFRTEPELGLAVEAILKATIDNVTLRDGPRGCLIACVAVEASGSMEDVRAFVANIFAETANIIENRMAAEVEAGNLSADIAPKLRANMLLDIMQGMALRARVGETRDSLIASVPSVVSLVLN